MKKVILSVVAISALAVTGAYADSSSDIQEMKLMMKQMNQRLAKLEQENIRLKSEVKKSKQTTSKKTKTTKHSTQIKLAKAEHQNEETAELVEKYKKATPVFAKTSKLKFSGKHYLGFTHQVQNFDAYNYGVYSAPDSSTSSDYFATRRNYLQVKGYFFENPKSYMRITLDTHQVGKGVPNAGDWEVRLKYAYLYIDEILPNTGVEFGQAHRPWIDYEEHHSWNYRSIAKVFVESKQDTDFTNSADLGINFKTKMDYFSSELGLFNGEGYHGLLDTDEENGLSFEWRLTANLLGTGKQHVHRHDRYADVSFYGQYNSDFSKKGDTETGDFVWYGLNAVYNQPEFLIAANYVNSTEAGISYKGKGWSVNGEFRLETISEDMTKWNTVARYDYYKLDAYEEARTAWLAGVTYAWNKNVEFILNYAYNEDPRLIVNGETGTQDDVLHAPQHDDVIMFTAEVNW